MLPLTKDLIVSHIRFDQQGNKQFSKNASNLYNSEGVITIDVGHMGPLSTGILRLVLNTQLPIEDISYCLRLPEVYLPTYQSKIDEVSQNDCYKAHLSVDVETRGRLTRFVCKSHEV